MSFADGAISKPLAGIGEMSDDFYRAFEERYRGPRELIKSRLRVYLPFVEPLRQFFDPARAVDLGCGRCEWVELLQASGFEVQGVDLDDSMLSACQEIGFQAQKQDGVDFLSALADASQVVVSGFHIAEHIPFHDLLALVDEAFRVLMPGGLLILETPNPENIIVGAANFYLDPTHNRPIPPQLLSFLPEYVGFKRTKILRLQEPPELYERKALTLLDVLGGVSPDYAVVAQKAGPEEIFSATDSAYEPAYGLALSELAKRYEERIGVFEARIAAIEALVEQIQETWLWRAMRWTTSKYKDLKKAMM